MLPTKNTSSGMALAATAAALLATAPLVAPVALAAESPDRLVQCEGGNGCKGASECATKLSSCRGYNACRGQGWVTITAAACEKVGGKPQD